MRAFFRFIMAICLGIAGTLAWQAFGDDARQLVAQQWPQLAWLAPAPDPAPAAQANASAAEDAVASAPAAAVASAAPDAAMPAAQAGLTPAQAVLPPEFMQQIETMARDLATARQGLDQLGASQGEMARNIAKLQATEQDILHKLTPAPQARPAPAPRSGQLSQPGPQLSSVPRPVTTQQLQPPPQLSPAPRSAPTPATQQLQPTPLAPPR